MHNSLCVLGAVLLSIQLCGLAAAEELVVFGAPFPLDTKAGSKAQDAYPQVTTDGRGTWIAVWHSKDKKFGVDFDILVARSTDGGVTWTAPVALNTNARKDSRDDGYPQVTTDGQGTWVAAWRSWDSLGGTIGTDTDILVARSTDGGVTWTAPAPLNSNAGSDAGDDFWPQVTTDGQGVWIAVWYSLDSLRGTIGTDRDILVARSTNGGVTWTAPAALNSNAGNDAGNDYYPEVTTDGQGVWIAVWYSLDSLGGTIGTDRDILVARSTNGGVTWTAPAPLNTNAGSDAGNDYYPQVTTDGWGTWVAVWDSSDSLGGAMGVDFDVLMARSMDGGVTWTAPAALNTNAGGDAGDDWYPQVTTDGQGTWIAVWYSLDSLGDTIGTDWDGLVARSTDGGVTWTAPAALNTNACSDGGDDFRPQLTTDGQGVWIAVWYSRDSLGGTIGTDPDILVAVNEPDALPRSCQTRAQQTCINALNKCFERVALAGDRAVAACLKSPAKTGVSAQACLAAPNPKVEKEKARCATDEAKRCEGAVPDFGPTDASTVNGVAAQMGPDMAFDLFGADPDAALVTQADDKNAARCQQAVAKTAGRCLTTEIKEFNRCKKTGLENLTIQRFSELGDCLGDDPRGRIAKACSALTTKVLPKTCGEVGLSEAFPGCGTGDPGELAQCVNDIVACRVCEALNVADGLAQPCTSCQ